MYCFNEPHKLVQAFLSDLAFIRCYCKAHSSLIWSVLITRTRLTRFNFVFPLLLLVPYIYIFFLLGTYFSVLFSFGTNISCICVSVWAIWSQEKVLFLLMGHERSRNSCTSYSGKDTRWITRSTLYFYRAVESKEVIRASFIFLSGYTNTSYPAPFPKGLQPFNLSRRDCNFFPFQFLKDSNLLTSNPLIFCTLPIPARDSNPLTF